MTDCRFGWRGYEGERFCHEHRGFLEAGDVGECCDRATQSTQLPNNGGISE